MKENKLYSLHVAQVYAGCNWQTYDINVEQLTVVENALQLIVVENPYFSNSIAFILCSVELCIDQLSQ